MQIEDFEKIQKLGEGTYGVVYKVKHIQTGKIYALKKLKIEYQESILDPRVLRELFILQQIKHENIIELIQYFFLEKEKQIYLLFHYEEIVLGQIIESKQIPYCIQKSFCYQLLQGIQYLHQNRIIHRDIKPDNILINSQNGNLYIADFGLARQFFIPFENLSPEIQTLWYKAPELLWGNTRYSLGIDIWAIGCVIAYLFLKVPLFKGQSEIEMLFSIYSIMGTNDRKLIEQQPYSMKKFPNFKRKFENLLQNQEKELIDLLSLLLEINPSKRITAEQALIHPFFNKQIIQFY